MQMEINWRLETVGPPLRKAQEEAKLPESCKEPQCCSQDKVFVLFCQKIEFYSFSVGLLCLGKSTYSLTKLLHPTDIIPLLSYLVLQKHIAVAEHV